MCNYHTWFHNEKSGYVIECKHCNKIQVCFGNLLLAFNSETFETFRQYLWQNFETISPDKDRHLKTIVIPTACVGTSMILSEAELSGLYEMIEYADTEMKTAAFISMFNVSE